MIPVAVLVFVSKSISLDVGILIYLLLIRTARAVQMLDVALNIVTGLSTCSAHNIHAVSALGTAVFLPIVFQPEYAAQIGAGFRRVTVDEAIANKPCVFRRVPLA